MLARFILPLLFGLVSSCSYQEQLPFKIVQICLPSAISTNALEAIMKATAANEGMTFIDNTDRARKGLAVTAQSPAQAEEAKWVISLIVEGPDGLGATATNLGLEPSNIAIGFTTGRSRDAARAFSDRLIGRISRQWTVVTVPEGEAAQSGACL